MFACNWLIRGSEHSKWPARGVSLPDDHAVDRLPVRLAGQAGQFHVAEAVDGEPRLPHFQPAAAAHVGIGRRRAAEILRIDRAVGIEHLGMPQHQPGAGRGRHLQPHHAHHVLAEIENPAPRPQAHGSSWVGVRRARGPAPSPGLPAGRAMACELGRRPGGVVQSGLVPTGRLPPRVRTIRPP